MERHYGDHRPLATSGRRVCGVEPRCQLIRPEIQSGPLNQVVTTDGFGQKPGQCVNAIGVELYQEGGLQLGRRNPRSAFPLAQKVSIFRIPSGAEIDKT